VERGTRGALGGIALLARSWAKVEWIEGLRLETTGTRRKPNLLYDFTDAFVYGRFRNLAPRAVRSNTSHCPLRIDRPLDDEVPLDPGMIAKRLLLTCASLLSMRDNDGADIPRTASDVVCVNCTGCRTRRRLDRRNDARQLCPIPFAGIAYRQRGGGLA
jgi:hypothetical protein